VPGNAPASTGHRSSSASVVLAVFEGVQQARHERRFLPALGDLELSRGEIQCRVAEVTPLLARVGQGDFCQRTYQPARLFARFLRRARSHIAVLCSPYRYLEDGRKSFTIWYFLFRQSPKKFRNAWAQEACPPKIGANSAKGGFSRARQFTEMLGSGGTDGPNP